MSRLVCLFLAGKSENQFIDANKLAAAIGNKFAASDILESELMLLEVIQITSLSSFLLSLLYSFMYCFSIIFGPC
jgi:hypothetical protein